MKTIYIVLYILINIISLNAQDYSTKIQEYIKLDALNTVNSHAKKIKFIDDKYNIFCYVTTCNFPDCKIQNLTYKYKKLEYSIFIQKYSKIEFGTFSCESTETDQRIFYIRQKDTTYYASELKLNKNTLNSILTDIKDLKVNAIDFFYNLWSELQLDLNIKTKINKSRSIITLELSHYTFVNENNPVKIYFRNNKVYKVKGREYISNHLLYHFTKLKKSDFLPESMFKSIEESEPEQEQN